MASVFCADFLVAAGRGEDTLGDVGGVADATFAGVVGAPRSVSTAAGDSAAGNEDAAAVRVGDAAVLLVLEVAATVISIDCGFAAALSGTALAGTAPVSG